MGEYIIQTTPEQDVALAYDTEQFNTMQTGMYQMSGQTHVAITPDERLAHLVASMLDATYRGVASTLDTVGTMVAKAAPESRNAMINTVESPALRNYLAKKHGGKD